MLWPRLHQYETHTTSPETCGESRFKVEPAMRLLVAHIASFLFIFALCEATKSGAKREETEKVRSRVKKSDPEVVEEFNSSKPDSYEDPTEESLSDDHDLPILPPIILLDFDNGTECGNSTDEKNKRTVNDGIGYGFERNTFRSGKSNYYFPAGPTGTTVTIEESISPFLPKTIIEKLPGHGSRTQPIGSQHGQSSGSTATDRNSYQSQRKPNYQYQHLQQYFGARRKLYKTIDKAPYAYQRYQANSGISSHHKNVYSSTTEGPSYAVTNSPDYSASSIRPYSYVTQHPSQSSSSYHPFGANSQTYAENQRPNTYTDVDPVAYEPQRQTVSSTPRTPETNHQYSSSNLASLQNSPRYTIENGVRYENKIFWKYPDGRISHVPPATYVEIDTQYSTTSRTPPVAQLHEPSQAFETDSGENGVYAQGPVQFPIAPGIKEPQASPFISSETISSSIPQQQVYRLGYQNLVGQKQSGNRAQQSKAVSGLSASHSPIREASSEVPNENEQDVNYDLSAYFERRPISKYMVNSPNPEYIDSYSTESPVAYEKSAATIFTSSGGGSSKKKYPANRNLDAYSKLQYADLLNYNPSISQYIRNPASILNVHPTFIQAGNSLVPVIILRVDGAPPIQPKASQNINLKALLRQYLLQYLNSAEQLGRSSYYDLGPGLDQDSKSHGPSAAGNRYPSGEGVQDSDHESSYNADPYYKRFDYEIGSSGSSQQRKPMTSKYGERTSSRPKVKSVQILEDPRLPTFKAKSQA